MTITELRDKLNKYIDKGYGDSIVGVRYYECDPRGPEEAEWYEWQLLKDVNLRETDIFDEEDDITFGLDLEFEEIEQNKEFF